MSKCYGMKIFVFLYLFVLSTTGGAAEEAVLEGTWRMVSYFNAGNQVRYPSEGYMMFGKTHWLHLVFLNRDERPQDFAEAHHGTYKITGPNTLDLNVDMDLHMDPKREFQKTQIWYGGVDDIEGASYRTEGNNMILDFPSTAQIVMEKIE